MSTTLILPRRRDPSSWYLDIDGIWATCQSVDDTKTYVFDYSDALDAIGSGVTISSSAWTASGVTTSSTSNTTTTTTVKVAGSGGSVRNTLTLSNGDVKVYDYRFMISPSGTQTDDYGNRGTIPSGF